MAKLTDTQLIVLSKAAVREDGAAIIPERLNKAAASKLAKSLVSRKLLREVRSKPGMPVWYEDEEGRGTSLIITRDGRAAIGIEEESNEGQRELDGHKTGQRWARAPNADSTKAPGERQRAETRIKAGTHHQAAFEEVGRDAGCTDRCYGLAAPYRAGGSDRAA